MGLLWIWLPLVLRNRFASVLPSSPKVGLRISEIGTRTVQFSPWIFVPSPRVPKGLGFECFNTISMSDQKKTGNDDRSDVKNPNNPKHALDLENQERQRKEKEDAAKKK